MKRKKLSVVIVTLGEWEYLDKTLNRLMEIVDLENSEIVCVDTGKDNDLLIKKLRKYPEVKYLRSPLYRSKNVGVNYGVSKTSGEYLLLLDNDVYFEDKNIINELLEDSSKLRNFGCYSLAQTNGYDKVSSLYGGYLSNKFILIAPDLSLNKIQSLHNVQISHPNGSAIFLKRKVWDMVGGYDEQYTFGGDDTDLGIRIWLYGYKCYLFSKSIQRHIGITKRKDNKKYSNYFGDKLYAHLSCIVKNYSLPDMCFCLIYYWIFNILKAIKQAFMRKSVLPIWGCIRGSKMFICNIKFTLKDRIYRQKIRISQNDLFKIPLPI